MGGHLAGPHTGPRLARVQNSHQAAIITCQTNIYISTARRELCTVFSHLARAVGIEMEAILVLKAVQCCSQYDSTNKVFAKAVQYNTLF